MKPNELKTLKVKDKARPGIYMIYAYRLDIAWIYRTKNIERSINEHNHKFAGNRHENTMLQFSYNNDGPQALIYEILDISRHDEDAVKEFYLQLDKCYRGVHPSRKKRTLKLTVAPYEDDSLRFKIRSIVKKVLE